MSPALDRTPIRCVTWLILSAAASAYGATNDVSSIDSRLAVLQQTIEQQQQQLDRQNRELEALRSAQEQQQAQLAETVSRADASVQAAALADDKAEAVVDQLERQILQMDSQPRVSIGGYGSMRGEVTDLKDQADTFTYRRFVLTADARPTNRLQTYLELELERFAGLELEKEADAGDSDFTAVQAVEGTNGSEIAIEQAWARYQITPSLNLDAGALLVPLGRFNLNHDDNEWNLTRRSLVDKGVPVLPSGAAWPELGAGISGIVPIGDGASLIDYRFYVVNGVSLDFELEEEVESEFEDAGVDVKSKLEAEFGPNQGTFSQDLNNDKALTGRLAFRPSPATEIAVSGYYGRYTPDYLINENVWSVGIDGLFKLGGIELEYQLIHTDWGNTAKVAESLAATAFGKEGDNAEITLGSNALADSRTGYWLEMRYPFWPSALSGTLLGRSFENPTIEPTLRFEQVFYNNQIRGMEFTDGALTELDVLDDARLSRATVGVAYRPTPHWVFSLAGEYTWTDQDSLAGLTDFLIAGPSENDAFALTAGIAFGF